MSYSITIYILILSINILDNLRSTEAHGAHNYSDQPDHHNQQDASDDIITRLLRGNAQFVNMTPPSAFQALAGGQSPGVVWISCSDSRVPMHVLTEANKGEAFSITNVANQYDPSDVSAEAALGYAVKTLRVPNIVVVGHEGCGGCAAALELAINSHEGYPLPHPTNSWDKALQTWILPIANLAYTHLLPRRKGTAYHHPKKFSGSAEKNSPRTKDEGLLSQLVELNVNHQMQKIAASDIAQSTWADGTNLKVHGWIYDILNGRIRVLGTLNRNTSFVQLNSTG